MGTFPHPTHDEIQVMDGEQWASASTPLETLVFPVGFRHGETRKAVTVPLQVSAMGAMGFIARVLITNADNEATNVNFLAYAAAPRVSGFVATDPAVGILLPCTGLASWSGFVVVKFEQIGPGAQVKLARVDDSSGEETTDLKASMWIQRFRY